MKNSFLDRLQKFLQNSLQNAQTTRNMRFRIWLQKYRFQHMVFHTYLLFLTRAWPWPPKWFWCEPWNAQNLKANFFTPCRASVELSGVFGRQTVNQKDSRFCQDVAKLYQDCCGSLAPDLFQKVAPCNWKATTDVFVALAPARATQVQARYILRLQKGCAGAWSC